MKTKIGTNLRKLRKDLHLNVKDVVSMLSNKGFDMSIKTLYAYENSQRDPGAEIFLALLEIYKCNRVLDVFSDIEVDYEIPSDAETQLLAKYRVLDDFGKGMVNDVLNGHYAHIIDEEKKEEKRTSAS